MPPTLQNYLMASEKIEATNQISLLTTTNEDDDEISIIYFD